MGSGGKLLGHTRECASEPAALSSTGPPSEGEKGGSLKVISHSLNCVIAKTAYFTGTKYSN